MLFYILCKNVFAHSILPCIFYFTESVMYNLIKSVIKDLNHMHLNVMAFFLLLLVYFTSLREHRGKKNEHRSEFLLKVNL